MKNTNNIYNVTTLREDSRNLCASAMGERRYGVDTLQNLHVQKMVADSLCVKKQEDVKKKQAKREQYGDEKGKFAREIRNLNIEINGLKEKVADYDEEISNYGYWLTQREYNEVVCRAFAKDGILRGWYKGDDERKIDRVVGHVWDIADQFCDRFRTFDPKFSIGDGSEAVSLLTKEEYIILRKDLEFLSYLIFGRSDKIKSNEVGLVLIGSISTTSRKMKAKNRDAILKQVLTTICKAHGLETNSRRGA